MSGASENISVEIEAPVVEQTSVEDTSSATDKINVLETKLNKLIEILKTSYVQVEQNEGELCWIMKLLNMREEINDL